MSNILVVRIIAFHFYQVLLNFITWKCKRIRKDEVTDVRFWSDHEFFIHGVLNINIETFFTRVHKYKKVFSHNKRQKSCLQYLLNSVILEVVTRGIDRRQFWYLSPFDRISMVNNLFIWKETSYSGNKYQKTIFPLLFLCPCRCTINSYFSQFICPEINYIV